MEIFSVRMRFSVFDNRQINKLQNADIVAVSHVIWSKPFDEIKERPT